MIVAVVEVVVASLGVEISVHTIVVSGGYDISVLRFGLAESTGSSWSSVTIGPGPLACFLLEPGQTFMPHFGLRGRQKSGFQVFGLEGSS